MAWLPRLSFPGASAVPPASHSRQINYSSRIAARYWRSLFWYRESPLMAVCHEYRRSKRRCATVREMKEGPSGSAIRS